MIQRTKAAVRDLDNLNYRKMKKILMVDSCETESTIGKFIVLVFMFFCKCVKFVFKNTGFIRIVLVFFVYNGCFNKSAKF